MNISYALHQLALALALALVVTCIVLAAALVGLALGLARLTRDVLGDRLTAQGNRLLRLSQRLSDALERLDAAMSICVRW